MNDRVRSCPYEACSRCEYGTLRAQFRSRTPIACKHRFVGRLLPIVPIPVPNPQPAFARSVSIKPAPAATAPASLRQSSLA